MARHATAAATLLAVLLLAGCSPDIEGSNEVKTLDEAKAELFAVETDLVAYVPSSAVTETTHAEDSAVLFDCDGGYTWPGSTQLRIDPSTDTQAILDDIYADYSTKSEWEAGWDETSGGRYLTMTREDGLKFAVGPLESGAVFDIASFSSCFALEDYDPNARY